MSILVMHVRTALPGLQTWFHALNENGIANQGL